LGLLKRLCAENRSVLARSRWQFLACPGKKAAESPELELIDALLKRLVYRG
jgi:hypothetical protein